MSSLRRSEKGRRLLPSTSRSEGLFNSFPLFSLIRVLPLAKR